MDGSVDAAAVRAYRVREQELDRRGRRRPSALAVLELGVQDTPYGSARLALAARTSLAVDDGALARDGVVPAWTLRGAPHLHRADDLPALAKALWPHDDADAEARFYTAQTPDAAGLGLSAFVATAEAFRQVVKKPMRKGEVSTEVSARVPAALTYACRPCRATHITGTAFQQAALFGGVRLDPTGDGTTLMPISGWAGAPKRADGTARLILAYLRLLGPATPTEVAKLLGTKTAPIKAVWPAGELAEVRVGRRRTWLPADRLDALRGAEPPETVRLLPPSDPLLQSRDRDVLVPERAHQKEVWRPLGNPGVLLAGADIVGTWRARQAKKSTLEVVVTPFGKLAAATRKAVADEAATVAAARGLSDVTVTVV